LIHTRRRVLADRVSVVRGKAKDEKQKGEQTVSERGNDGGGLEGQAALVTGASSGLGRAVAVALAEAGADVALLARSEKDLRETEERVSRTGRRALALPTDLASASETRAAVERTAEGLGGVPFLLSKAAFPLMREAGGGTIVNVSSVAGKKGWANASAYCASKFGLTGLTEALADEGRQHGIRAIVIYPGAMATNWGAFSPEERGEGKGGETSPAAALPPSRVADFIAWFAASPREFVLTEGIIVPIGEGLP
jgi:NAD(P)-dependent dehydrogenase (short-subunit alcohol dehydrogenase family)